VVYGVICTHFGGVDDKQDNGITESGISLRDGAEDKPVPGCALPMQTYTELGYGGGDTSSSPIPALPYKDTLVQVMYQGKSITVPLIDRGPSPEASSHAAIDLTNFSFSQLADLNTGIIDKVDFRILGAAKYLTNPYRPPNPPALSL